MAKKTSAKLSADLADAIAETVRNVVGTMQVSEPVWGVVTAVDSVNHVLTLQLSGSTTPITGIAYLKTYTPTIGDTVYGHKTVHDLLIHGTVA